MSDYSATFAVQNKCVLLNTGGNFALCECGEGRPGNSLRKIERKARRRARRTRLAGGSCRCHAGNALTKERCGCCR